MRLSELDETEREVFLALLAHLAEADARIDPKEILAIDTIAEEMEITDVRERMMRALAATRSREDLLRALARVRRQGAREAIRASLSQLAESDGEKADSESALIELLSQVWGASAEG